MGVYCYQVTAKQTKTDLGFNFHLGTYCFRYGGYNEIFDTKPKWRILAEARLDRTQSILEQPNRWSRFIGVTSHGTYDIDKPKQLAVGVVVNIHYREYPTSDWDDVNDPGLYICSIEKIGRGKWKKVVNEDRKEIPFPENSLTSSAS